MPLHNADIAAIFDEIAGLLEIQAANPFRFGVGQARRGWLEAKDVLNTRPLAELMTLLGH